MRVQEYKILQSLYCFNLQHADFYRNVALYENRIFIKVFFERMYSQKNSFCTALKILLLRYKEHDEACFVKYTPKYDKRDFHLLVFNPYKKEILQESYHRELTSLHHYNSLFEDIHNAEIKEVVLNQRNLINNAVAEMRFKRMDRYLSAL